MYFLYVRWIHMKEIYKNDIYTFGIIYCPNMWYRWHTTFGIIHLIIHIICNTQHSHLHMRKYSGNIFPISGGFIWRKYLPMTYTHSVSYAYSSTWCVIHNIYMCTWGNTTPYVGSYEGNTYRWHTHIRYRTLMYPLICNTQHSYLHIWKYVSYMSDGFIWNYMYRWHTHIWCRIHIFMNMYAPNI